MRAGVLKSCPAGRPASHKDFAAHLRHAVIKDFTTKYLGASSQQSQGLIRVCRFAQWATLLATCDTQIWRAILLACLCVLAAYAADCHDFYMQTAKKNGEKLGFLA